MKVIALHGEQEKVAVYDSAQLAAMRMPARGDGAGGAGSHLFDWQKGKDEGLKPLDEEVVFDHAKLKEKGVRKDDE